MNRRTFIKTTATSVAALSFAEKPLSAANEQMEKIKAEVAKRHDESVQRLQQWIHQP
jgi:hypothetical protein